MPELIGESDFQKFGKSEDADFGKSMAFSEASRVYALRLRQVCDRSSVAEFARRSGVAHSTLAAIIEGKSLPRWDTAVKISSASGRTLDWFATPLEEAELKGLAFEGYALGEPPARFEVHSEFALLPLYDVRAAAGHGAWNDQERISKTLAFRRDWIASNFQATPEHLALIYVDGDSMSPRLSDGDVVMVDRSVREVRRDGMYVFTLDGALLIKHLQRLPGDRVRAMSENPLFPPFELNADQLDPARSPNSIVGSVVWGGIRL